MTYVILWFWVLFLCYVWFETDAVQEYLGLVNVNALNYKEFLKERNEGTSIASSHHVYLLAKHNGFLTRLIVCPLCLCVWINVFGYVALCLNFFFLSVSIIAAWIGYFALCKAIRFLHE